MMMMDESRGVDCAIGQEEERGRRREERWVFVSRREETAGTNHHTKSRCCHAVCILVGGFTLLGSGGLRDLSSDIDPSK